MAHFNQDPFLLSGLLLDEKACVQNLSLTITETTSPHVREMLTRQLLHAISSQAEIFNYAYASGVYPSHNVDQLIQIDLRLAQQALSLPIE